MTKNCPKCGKELPDNAKFCMDCGYGIEKQSSSESSNIFSNGKIFIILIAVILVVGGLFIVSSGLGGGNSSPESNNDVAHDASPVDLTISEVGGWKSEAEDDMKESYTLYTEALFDKVPDDIKGYNVKTKYYDANGSEIGHETEKLDEIYYDSSYSIGFGYYTSYKMPNPDHVTVEIIKDGKVIDNYTEKIDRNKIDYLN